MEIRINIPLTEIDQVNKQIKNSFFHLKEAQLSMKQVTDILSKAANFKPSFNLCSGLATREIVQPEANQKA